MSDYNSNSNYDDGESRSRIESKNATYFRASEAPSGKERKFRRLWAYNEELKTSPNHSNREELWRRDRIATLDAISSTLELNDTQYDRALHVLQNLDATEDMDGSYISLEAISFGICVVVYNRTIEQHSNSANKFIPSRDDELNPDRFCDMRDELGLSEFVVGKAVSQMMDNMEVYNES
jgi:hypothetical protein